MKEKCRECGEETEYWMSVIHEDKNGKRRYGLLCQKCMKKPHSSLTWWQK